MRNVILHAAPRMREVVREQIRIVGLALRREALVVAVVLGTATLVIAVDITRGSAASWFDSDEWAALGVVAFLSPFAVWRRERRFGPAFLWTLPVDRRRLALARVFAGWVWLMLALAVFTAWERTMALISGIPNAEVVRLDAFIGTTLTYLLGSALVLGSRHPLRWLLGTVGVFLLLGTLNRLLGLGPDGVLDERLSATGFFSAIRSWRTLPQLAQWAIATVLSFGALSVAVSRRGERRRH